MKYIIRVFLIVLMIGVISGLTFAELSADEILQKADNVLDSPSTILGATMITTNTQGVEKSSDMLVYVKKGKNDKTLSMIEYLSPASDKGIKFLSLGSVDQMWMYLPDIEKSVRIAGSMIKQSMMNSDFSYQDLMDRSNYSDYYTPQLQGSESVNGEDCYVLNLTAKKGNAQYRRLKLYVRKDNLIASKVESFSGADQVNKVSTFTNLQVMGNRTIPTKITFKDLTRKGKETVLLINKAQFNASIPERVFSMQYLEKGL